MGGEVERRVVMVAGSGMRERAGSGVSSPMLLHRSAQVSAIALLCCGCIPVGSSIGGLILLYRRAQVAGLAVLCHCFVPFR